MASFDSVDPATMAATDEASACKRSTSKVADIWSRQGKMDGNDPVVSFDSVDPVDPVVSLEAIDSVVSGEFGMMASAEGFIDPPVWRL